MKTIRFKSTPDIWRKEYLGLKKNTLRKPDSPKDIRFEILSDFVHENYTMITVEIENSITHEIFSRLISDVTIYDEYFIISWS